MHPVSSQTLLNDGTAEQGLGLVRVIQTLIDAEGRTAREPISCEAG
jgi:hypothetical protein